MTDDNERLLTPKEIGELLSVSARTVCRLIERGELRGIRVGRQPLHATSLLSVRDISSG
jgi:excisionase family DNA binding protein